MGQTCSYQTVQPGDSCGALASRCNITPAQFTQYNPGSSFCSTLKPGQLVCCSEGVVPDLRPQPKADGTCFDYTVQDGEYCALIAEKNYLTVAEIESFNSKTWGWGGCSTLQRAAKICLSTGDPPMPATDSRMVCGPQVPGTARPANWADISSLNPCVLNACCDVWGQCGTTPEFCTPSKSATGAPGTAAPNTNGCISNCGTDIVNNNTPPAEFITVGYFEGFNPERPCLNMAADQIPAGKYSHVHFAFAGINPDFSVSVSGMQDQFLLFTKQTGFKRILSFGGWSFSTGADSAPIFSSSYNHGNRLAFARSVVAVVQQFNLDGVDFDWEYPGATDIPGYHGSASDGANYLVFINIVRQLLPANKTISVAAPASFWYLQGFPIAEIAKVVDYIIYMTYDLHGQWDYGKNSSQDGCPGGNCLRSHVNLTETAYALSMVTKAGVPSNKLVVGLASYGRSFRLAQGGCVTPNCLYTGPVSRATPGNCTGTPGMIAQAEIERLVSTGAPGAATWYDAATDSDFAVYDRASTWTSYMSDKTKAGRASRYRAMKMGGTVDWAIDLAAFVPERNGTFSSSAATARRGRRT